MNNNDKFDEGEKIAKNIEIKLAGETKKTDKDGKAIFYGIPNRVLYDLNAEIKRPSLLQTPVPLKVEGKNTATIEAYLPIKPMTTLTGQINDISGKELEVTMPDETGTFDVSGLLPTEYLIEVNYIGINYSIKGINEVVQLSYIEKGKDGNLFVFNFDKEGIKLMKNWL